jgi:hypothetical protein
VEVIDRPGMGLTVTVTSEAGLQVFPGTYRVAV